MNSAATQAAWDENCSRDGAFEFEAEQLATVAVFHAHDFGVDVAAGGANVLAHDSNRQLDFQVASRDKGGGSQDQHADGADVEGGEKFLEGFAVGIDAVRKHRKRQRQTGPSAQIRNAGRPHTMIVA
jgi:hypothetical protein